MRPENAVVRKPAAGLSAAAGAQKAVHNLPKTARKEPAAKPPKAAPDPVLDILLLSASNPLFEIVISFARHGASVCASTGVAQSAASTMALATKERDAMIVLLSCVWE